MTGKLSFDAGNDEDDGERSTSPTKRVRTRAHPGVRVVLDLPDRQVRRLEVRTFDPAAGASTRLQAPALARPATTSQRGCPS